MASKQSTVERKIYFYRVDAGHDEAGRSITFGVPECLKHIDGLPLASGERYWDEGADRHCCWIDNAASPQRLRFARVRRSALPQMERGGLLQGLSLPSNAGLAEQIHVVFFPKEIVGVDFNFYGPRLSRLGGYLAEKGCLPVLSFEPLLNNDVLRSVQRLEEVTMLQLRIRAPFADVIAKRSRSLGAAFRAAANAGDADVVEVVLRPAPWSKGHLADRLVRVVRSLAGDTSVREQALSFKLRGRTEDGLTDVIDVLADQLITTKRIVQQDDRSKALDRDAAYVAIREAYAELRPQLEAAAAAQG